MKKPLLNSSELQGVGHNLRLEFIDEFLESKPDVGFVEIIGDNWFSDGPHHEKLEKVRKDYQLLIHFVGMNIGGKSEINFPYLDKVKYLTDKFDPVHISDHLAIQNTDTVYFHDLLPFSFSESNLIASTEKLNKIRDYLKSDIPFLVENLSYYIEFKDSEMSEHEFLNKLVRDTGSSLLLDINNIWVNEKNLSHSANEFLEGIDWSSVKEVHLAGPEKLDDVLVDTHGSFPDEECLLYASNIKEKIENLPIIYERDNNIPAYPTLLEETKRIDQILFGKELS